MSLCVYQGKDEVRGLTGKRDQCDFDSVVGVTYGPPVDLDPKGAIDTSVVARYKAPHGGLCLRHAEFSKVLMNGTAQKVKEAWDLVNESGYP